MDVIWRINSFFFITPFIFVNNSFQKRKLGPGSYEIKDFLELADEKPRSTRGIIQTKEERFKEKITQAVCWNLMLVSFRHC